MEILSVLGLAILIAGTIWYIKWLGDKWDDDDDYPPYGWA